MPGEAEAAAPAPADGGFDVAAFLAANPPTASEEDAPAAEGAEPEGESDDAGPLGDSETEAETALLAAMDGDGEETEDSEETAAEGGASESEDDAETEEEPAAEHKALDVDALKAALKAKNPEAFLAALGDDAEHVLGAKAHRALRLAAKDVAGARSKLLKASDELKAKFGEPAEIRKAMLAGDADAAVEGIERFTGATWADFIKFVNASFAGKEARLETKLADEKKAAEAKAETERAEAAAATEKQAKAVAQLKTAITGLVKKQQPTLAKFPGIDGLVFDKLKAEFRNGVNTPEKALAAVVVDLRERHTALSAAFAPPGKKKTKTAPPPREPSGRRGREMTDEEFNAEFLKHHKP